MCTHVRRVKDRRAGDSRYIGSIRRVYLGNYEAYEAAGASLYSRLPEGERYLLSFLSLVLREDVRLNERIQVCSTSVLNICGRCKSQDGEGARKFYPTTREFCLDFYRIPSKD